MENSNTGMFVPLYYSNLYKSIRKGEDIIYSVYYKVNLFDTSSFNNRKIWYTHLLITTNGLYFGWYQRKKHPKVKFISWLEVKKITRRKIKIESAQYSLKPKRERNFETWRNFRNRKKEVSGNIKKLMRKGKEINLSEISKQMELSKKRPRTDKSLLQEILGDKWKEEFRIVEEAINLERKLRGEHRIGPKVQYVDIKKGKMKNQVNSILLDLILLIVFLMPLAIFMRVVPYTSLDQIGMTIITFLTLYLAIISYHRWRVRKKNFELPQSEGFSWKEGKKFLHYLEFKEKSMGKIMPRMFMNFKAFDKGMKAYTLKNFEEGVRFVVPITETEPDVVSAWYMLLECLYYLGKWEEMVMYGMQAIRINPSAGMIYAWLGEAHNHIGKDDQAINYYKKGLKLLESELMDDPKDDNILNMQGHIHLELGHFEEGIRYNKEALKIKPKSEHHTHGIGLGYKKLGNYDEAIKYLEMSLRFNPKHSYAWYDLGLIYENKGELEKAILHFEKAVEFSPQWVKLRQKLISLKMDSPALLITAPSILDKKSTKRRKRAELFYDNFAKGRKDRIQKYQERKEEHQQYIKEMREGRLKKYTKNISELLEMDASEWEQYLENTINGIERTLKSGLDYFENKNRLQIPDIYRFSALEDTLEDRKNQLTNLRIDDNFITKIKERAKNDFESFKQREKERDFTSGLPNIRGTLKNNLIKMNVNQYIKFLKRDIRIRQELIEREALKGGKTPFLADLEKGLIQTTMDLNNLEKDPSYIDTIRKRIENSLDG